MALFTGCCYTLVTIHILTVRMILRVIYYHMSKKLGVEGLKPELKPENESLKTELNLEKVPCVKILAYNYEDPCLKTLAYHFQDHC